MTQGDSAQLAQPITSEELEAAVCDLQRGKAPGWDGIPPEVYLSFWNIPGPLLLSTIHYSFKHGGFSRDANMALIYLLLKEDKEPTECSSDRP